MAVDDELHQLLPPLFTPPEQNAVFYAVLGQGKILMVLSALSLAPLVIHA